MRCAAREQAENGCGQVEPHGPAELVAHLRSGRHAGSAFGRIHIIFAVFSASRVGHPLGATSRAHFVHRERLRHQVAYAVSVLALDGDVQRVGAVQVGRVDVGLRIGRACGSAPRLGRAGVGRSRRQQQWRPCCRGGRWRARGSRPRGCGGAGCRRSRAGGCQGRRRTRRASAQSRHAASCSPRPRGRPWRPRVDRSRAGAA